jgi:hypothetical protein
LVGQKNLNSTKAFFFERELNLNKYLKNKKFLLYKKFVLFSQFFSEKVKNSNEKKNIFFALQKIKQKNFLLSFFFQ